MKKALFLLCFTIAMFTMISCSKVKERKYNDYIENDTTELVKTVIIDSVECINQYQDGDFVRIVTSKMMSDSVFLRKVINEFNLNHKVVYFHIPELQEKGEQYAFFSGDNIFVYENPPKSKADVEAIKVTDNIAANISNLEVLNMNKNLEYEGISGYLETIDNAALACRDYKENDNIRVKEQLKKLSSKLKSTQIAVFPRLRKLFAEESKKRLWEENIEVSHSGRTISFTGYVYASNKNIKESYEAISVLLYNLRFSRINFRWSEYDGFTYYNINSPADGVIVEN